MSEPVDSRTVFKRKLLYFTKVTDSISSAGNTNDALKVGYVFLAKYHGSTFCCNKSAWVMKEKLNTN